VLWESLSRTSPWLDIPHFAIPSIATIGQSLLKISLIDVVATMVRVFASLVLSFVIGTGVAVAILITHQLEEAIEVGDRVIVFGKGASLLADTSVASWPVSRRPELRRAIQSTLSNNVADPVLIQLPN
jgi:hypothetical protein